MDYYNILNLVKEPFSNSPDPEFFYQSQQHLFCLQQLELSLHLRRGLNVVIGDVGIGKTTLCRHLIRKFADYADIETHLILDPHFNNPSEFLAAVVEKFESRKPPRGADDPTLKEMVKQYLYHQGVHEKKNVILIIDEGQKIPRFCMELLREFLNYETNKYKLLQIVIFAQKEFTKTLKAYANFADRINFYHLLKPLGFSDTRHMIQFRLHQSSGTPQPQSFFSYPALRAVYRATGGYPRKIVNLCHQCIIAMIVQNRSVVDWLLVNQCVKKVFPKPAFTWYRVATAAALAVFAGIVFMAGIAPTELRKIVWPWNMAIPKITLTPRSEPKIQMAQAPISPVQTFSRPPLEIPQPATETSIVTHEQPAAATSTTQPNPSQAYPEHRFSVQIGAFRSEANAENLLYRFQSKGYEPYIFHFADSRKREWFAVRIGDYPDLTAAHQAAQAFQLREKAATAITYKDSLSGVKGK